MSIATRHRPSRHRSVRGLVALAAGAAVAVAGATAATADTQEDPDATTEGWIRLAHLSPDTPAVDVSLIGVDSADGFELEDVGYGDVSGYARLPAGAYAVEMVPAGSPAGTDPVVSQVVEVSADRAYTATAAGLNADLTVTVLTDDLSAPSEGQARVRVIQASVSSDTVDVTTDTGTAIAEDVAFGTATDYTEVEPGRWTLEVDGTEQSGTVQVDLAPASVSSLFVLDRDGELSITAIEDSAGSGEVPAGGVATGGGGLHLNDRGPIAPLVTVLLSAVALLVVLMVVDRRRRAV